MSGTRLLLGAGGMLATSIVNAVGARGQRHGWALLGEDDVDMTDESALKAALDDVGASVIVNAAGYTNVRGAEHDAARCFAVNADAVGSLARWCEHSGARLVHVSTDYVFDGKRNEPWREDDPTGPVNVYARSKLAGEEAIRASGAAFLIVRTAWLFAGHGNNFVRAIARKAAGGENLRVADDQTGSPTSADDLAGWILELIERGTGGVVHTVNSGEATWFDLASEVVRALGARCAMARCKGAEFDPTTPRPAYTVLNTDRLAGILGRRPRDWREAVDDVVRRIGGR